MFQIAVLGPQFADRLGIVQQCMQCRAAAGADAPPCTGFGPGCLVTPARTSSRPGYVPEPEEKMASRMSIDALERMLDAAAFGGSSAYADICFDVDPPQR